MKIFILAMLSVSALFFLIGSLCAWGEGNIGFGQLLIQVAISIIVEWFSLKKMDI